MGEVDKQYLRTYITPSYQKEKQFLEICIANIRKYSYIINKEGLTKLDIKVTSCKEETVAENSVGRKAPWSKLKGK